MPAHKGSLFPPETRLLWQAAGLGSVAVGTLASGARTLWQRDPESPLTMAAGLALVAASALQAWIILRYVARERSAARAQAVGGRRLSSAYASQAAKQAAARRAEFLRRLLVGVVAAWLAAALLVGAGAMFQAVFAAWYTVALCALVVPGPKGRLGARPVGRLSGFAGRLTFAAAALALGGELCLRAAEMVWGRRLVEWQMAQSLKLSPGREIGGRTVNALGYWDDEFELSPPDGRFRIAALGSGITLSGSAETNCLAQVERRLPDVDVYNFGVPQAGPREHAALLPAEVARYRPDLVLAFFSVGEHVLEPLPLPGAFDWRSLRLVQLAAPRLLLAAPSPPEGVMATEYEAYLRSVAGRLAVCRTPIVDPVERHWREALGHLDKLVGQCRRRKLSIALVLVPSEFQINPQLCETVRRRAGYQASELDLDLPQRRLARFADERDLPVLDLLPYFRAAQGGPLTARHEPTFTQHAHEVAGEVIGDWLASRYRRALAANVP